MRYRTLGRSGYQVSEIGLGCWQLGGDFGYVENDQATAILNEAHRHSITFWDTADVYGDGLSEQRIGDWCRRNCTAQGAQRPVIATKVGRNGELYPNGYTKEQVRRSLTGSLERLGGDALDLAQLHCVPFDVLKTGDLLGWMDDFQREGLVRHFGASVETVEEGLFCLGHPSIVTLQIIFNLFRQDAAAELLPRAQAAGVGIIVRLPLASGLLSGQMTAEQSFAPQDHRNYNRNGEAFHVGETFSGLPFAMGMKLVEELQQLVPRNMPLCQFALGWILAQPAVSTVIAGASRSEQVIANAAVSEMFASPAMINTELHQELADFYRQQVRRHVRGQI